MTIDWQDAGHDLAIRQRVNDGRVIRLEPEKSAADLLREAEALEPGVGPWKVDTEEHVGDNWLICSLGTDQDGRSMIVSTDSVHASEMDGEPDSDAEWIVWCRNHWADLIALMRAAASAAD